MTDRDTRILYSARDMFARYGVAKTTMTDIAAAAGVTRQTVYNAYPGKPEIMRAVVRMTIEDSIRAVTRAWRDAPDLGARIDLFLDLAPLAWFRAVSAAPDLAELMEGVHSAAATELAEAEAQWTALLTEMLEQAGAVPTDPSLGRAEVAEFLYSAAVNAKYGVDGVEMLQRRLRVLRAATLALLRVDSGG